MSTNSSSSISKPFTGTKEITFQQCSGGNPVINQSTNSAQYLPATQSIDVNDRKYLGITQQPECSSIGAKAFFNLSKPENLLRDKTKLNDNVTSIHLKSDALDTANCKPYVARSTLTKIPRNPDVLMMSGIPFAMFFQPFGDKTDTKRVDSTIAQCHKPTCSAYIHPFTDFTGPDAWQCSFCETVNYLSETIQHQTKEYPCIIGPELTSASVDFPTSPSQNGDQLTKLPVYLYLLDTSAGALATGYLPLFCDTLLTELGRAAFLPRARIGFITYDKVVHLYKRGSHSQSPLQQLIFPLENIQEIANDIKGRSLDYLLNIVTFYDTITDFLKQLPLLFHRRPSNLTHESSTSALGAALILGLGITRSHGGRITVVQVSRPNIEPVKLDESTEKIPSFLEKWGLGYFATRKPSDTFYRSLGIKFCKYFVSVDLFLLGGQNLNLASLADVAKLSGGNSYRFLAFNRNDSCQSKQFERTLRHYLSREIGWNTSIEQKIQSGFKIVKFFGNHSQDPFERCERIDLPVIHPDTNFGFELSLDEIIPNHVERVCFQVVLHYKTSTGQHRTRIHTIALPATDSLAVVVKSVDQQCLAACLMKLTAEELLTAKEQRKDVIFRHLKHECERVSASYRSALALLSLMTPYRNRRDNSSDGTTKGLKSLLLDVTALIQSGLFKCEGQSRDDCAFILERWRALPLSQLILLLFSRLHAVDHSKTI